MTPRARRWAIGAGMGAIALAAIGVAARQSVEAPRCPDGAVALGARCCGEGQSLEGGRCTGKPARCPAGLHKTDEGCIAITRQKFFEGGNLLASVDWEAAGQSHLPRGAVAAFTIDCFEVTEAHWARCVADKLCPAVPLSGEPGLPVRGVSRADAEAFCRFVSGRLPTPEEHAFAGAGTEGSRYPWGGTGAVCRRAAFGLVSGPCGDGATGPDLAGMRPDGATPTGVHDLAGNVAEWSVDKSGRAWIRGGSYKSSSASALRTWSGTTVNDDAAADDVGFRCVYPAK